MENKISQRRPRRRDGRQGNSIVEFAVIVPVLFMLTLGAADFARLFIEAHAVTGASNSGVVFGARRNVDAAQTGVMETRALADVDGAKGAVATATQYCDCPDNPGMVVGCSTMCNGSYGMPRVYVQTRVSKTFTTVGRYPWMPSSANIGSTSWMRVQ